MRIKNEASELREFHALLSKANLGEFVSDESALFFPFEIGDKVEEKESGVILLETKTEGSKNFVKPGFLVTALSGEPVVAYVTTEYAVKLDIETHLSLFPNSKQGLNKKKLEALTGLDCFLVKRQQILASFKF